MQRLLATFCFAITLMRDTTFVNASAADEMSIWFGFGEADEVYTYGSDTRHENENVSRNDSFAASFQSFCFDCWYY